MLLFLIVNSASTPSTITPTTASMPSSPPSGISDELLRELVNMQVEG